MISSALIVPTRQNAVCSMHSLDGIFQVHSHVATDKYRILHPNKFMNYLAHAVIKIKEMTQGIGVETLQVYSKQHIFHLFQHVYSNLVSCNWHWW
jgi:hypothetical protein